jgi:hypothetical protein
MNSTLRWATLALMSGLCATGCATPRRATLAQLQQRILFDMGCPPQQLMLYHIDGRTKAVAGCGRRLVYLERCDSGAGDICSWEIDSPSLGQDAWPARVTQATGQSARAQWAMQPGVDRQMPTKLFEPGGRPPVRPTPTGRALPTDLFGNKRDAKRPATGGATDPAAPQRKRPPAAATPPARGTAPATAPTTAPTTPPPTPYDTRL